MLKDQLVEVRKNHFFDIEKLQAWLNKKFPDYGKIEQIKQFIGGQSNPTFFVLFKSKNSCILRKKPPGNLLPSAHAIEREYRVQKALEKSVIPCPKMIVLCEDMNIIGTPFYLMDVIKGNVFDSIFEIDNTKLRKKIFLSMVKMLANLHNVDYRKVKLDNYGKGEGYILRQINRWEKQWDLSKQRELDEIKKITEWLKYNLPDDCSTSLVHGDFRLGNLIFKDNTKEIVAVLDWELSTIGHPFSDLGYLLHTHYVPKGERHGLKGYDFVKENIPSINEIIKEYCKIRNLKEFDPTFYIILSMFRSIAILEGVYARYVNGNASSPKAKEIGEDVEPLAKATFDVIKYL
tara:strand:+ start:192 stop:1232 length:1041 start_codon:yes stop_codon:yes gene_type:complete